jgi:hypothetical protein
VDWFAPMLKKLFLLATEKLSDKQRALYRRIKWRHDLVRFLNSLAQKQEPLGEPFQTVLHENRWDLYIKS